MFTVKILGCLFVIISSTMIGMEYSKKYTERLNNLVYVQNCIQLLETEIVYSCNPLPNALENVYNKGNKKVSFLFEEIRKYLLENKDKTLFESFEYSLSKFKDKLYLEDEDTEIILSLGRVLGVSDRLDQEKHFKTILVNLEMNHKDANEKKSKNAKMYKSLGVLFGFALVLILY
ncbi:stage III sporulation protein AB [Gottschalkia acidurici 9a]|uniref:Stage III sporulation protein AB n=1 Tax=Gottschalkia acidurici (strain ATCC 7906 / DSM 604 / BCRC 14475 / CIP 104303 / KCTC 5404 / NCIMB 10678 / 9a) TaxID=1128398 RepID=K0AX56_GOTA9|nr:stage III sporulation protein SpoIIIAB [Gottschalkia acidurici]AFS78383.1 stage III sporulation protein AB [Gottschalkia acidurici 9a]